MDKIDQIRRWLQSGREFTTSQCRGEVGGNPQQIRAALTVLERASEVVRVGYKRVTLIHGRTHRAEILWRTS